MAAQLATTPVLGVQRLSVRNRRLTLINAGAATANVLYWLKDEANVAHSLPLTSGSAWEVDGEAVAQVALDTSNPTATVQFIEGWIFRSLAATSGTPPTLTPWFVPIFVELSATSLAEQVVFVVPVGQIYEMIDTVFNNANAPAVTETLKVYDATPTVYDTISFANAGGQVTTLAPHSTSYFGALVPAGGKVTVTLSATAGAGSTLVAYARRVA